MKEKKVRKEKIEKLIHYRVRLWPVSMRRMADGVWLRPLDYEWSVQQVDPDRGVKISNIHTGHAPWLGFDHIHHFDTDPNRDTDGFRHGVLELNKQLVLQGCDVHFLPRHDRRPRQRLTRTDH